jgi:bisphosphoglycerate-dependent phosphoglycerate mutase
MKNKIYLFRHGQTYYNKNKIFTGWKDSKLTPKGINDAKNIAQKLKGERIDVAIHTSLSRSKDTLKYVLAFHPECKVILVDDRMIERSYGDLAGKTHKKIIEEFGKEQYEIWHRGYSINGRPPKGECFADVEKRVSKFISWLKSYIKKNKVNVAISAHGNSIRLFRKIMENLSVEKTIGIEIPYDKVYIYEVGDEK